MGTDQVEPPHIRAVTFDFWCTLFEPGQDTLRTRARRLAGWLDASEDAVHTTLVEAWELHNAEWRAGRCWGARELAHLLLRRFDPAVGPADGLRELVEHVEMSGVAGGEHVVEGAAEVILTLRRQGLRLGIISDTGFTPGRVLRRFLDAAGLLQHFKPAALIFSDEVGVPKPNPRIFQAALNALGVQPDETVHVGDLRSTDVVGASAMGMGSVRFKGSNDDCGDGPDAVISRLADLPGALGLD
jgi:putative hydrolase of the HAD superfamily